MRKNIFMLVFFILSFFFYPSFVSANQGNVIPITISDVERNKTLTPQERWNFIVEYYVKNKKNGATDEQIINELVKLLSLDKENAEKIRKIVLLGYRYKTLEDMAQDIVNKINLSILEKNPGRVDMLIDISDTNTWKNIKNLTIGQTRVVDFFKIFQEEIYFSNFISTEKMDSFLMSCADTGKDKIMMSIYLSPSENRFLAVQEEGKAPDGIQIDFSGSENLIVDPFFLPMEKAMTVNGKKVFGYDRAIYIPFKAALKDPQKNGVVHAKVTANVCQNNVCQKETLPEIVYTTDKSTFESSLCHKNTQEYVGTPKSQQSGIKLENAYFRKEKTGEVDLIASFHLPALRRSKIFFLVRNEQGLNFSEPFLMEDDRTFLAKIRLLNPEKLKDKANLTFDIGYSDAASEFNKEVRIETKTFEPSVSFFSFSLLNFFKSFLQGLKVFILTPVFALFLLMLSQLVSAPEKTFDKSFSFCVGLSKAFLSGFLLVWAVVCLAGFFPVFRNIIWGEQFSSPLLNFVFMNIFLLIAANWRLVFDDTIIERFGKPFEALFSVFDFEDEREKAGAVAVIVIGLLLLITPMTNLYYQTYDLLSQSYLFYSIAFLAGLAVPFLILSLFIEQITETKQNKYVHRILGWIVFLSFYLQALMLLLSIGVDVEKNVLFGTIALVVVSIVLMKKAKQFFNKGLACITLIGVCFIPLMPSEKTLNNFWGVEFDQASLRRQVEEGKNVYLSVSENFCISCLWNRFVVSRALENQIRAGTLSVMRIGYNDPFIKNIIFQNSLRSLPMNIVFSPKYPEGKIIAPDLKLWAMSEIAEDAFVFKKSEPTQQTPPEETAPKPEEKGTN